MNDDSIFFSIMLQ